MNFLETLDYDWLDVLNFQERPFRAKLIPAKVWRDLDLYRNDPTGLSNYCKKWRTKIEYLKVPKKNKTYEKYVAVGGEYDPEFRQCTIHIYTLNFNTFQFSDISWSSFKKRFLQTLMHEMIHFMQFDRRDNQWSTYVLPYKRIGQKKKDAERKYLSEFDEIQAYAHCVYLDLKMNRPRVALETLLSRCKHKRDSSTLHYFLKTFNYDFKNNVATQKIIQQIGKWDRKYKS